MSNVNKYEELSKEFEFIDEFDIPLARNSSVKRFIHKKSGFTLILNPSPGPKCNASIVVPTESFNDKGLPHTLEHLIFTGCDDIPFRELLEVLSNRCLSAPCNAYTAEDHTCYSIDSVGPEGILHYLPIYLKYILTPTLKDSDFVTEVYHIDSNGKDQGVVLCEMQARENTPDDLLEINMCKNIFDGCGYQYSFGGITSEIAKLDNQMVRDYHGKFYHPKFMTLVVQGCIDTESLFKVLDNVNFTPSPFFKPEQHQTNENDKSSYVPWMSEIPPLLKSKSSLVPFPSESETGSVAIGWRGPPINDVFTITALTILLRYLQDNTSSPLQQRFLNKTTPLASTVYAVVHEVKDTKITIEFSGVPVKYKQPNQINNEDNNNNDKKVIENGNNDKDGKDDEQNDEEDNEQNEEEEDEEDDEEESENSSESESESDDEDEGDNNLFNEKSIYDRLIKVFKDLRLKGFPEKDSIKKVIEKELIKTMEGYEDDPLGTVFGSLLPCIAFPSTEKQVYSDIKSRFYLESIFEELSNKPDQFWFDLIDKYFIDKPYVEILLKPDSKLSETLSNETIQRFKERVEKYGPKGMEELGERVRLAIENNKSFPPEKYDSLLPSQVFDINKIPLIKIESDLKRAYTQENPNSFTIQTMLVPTHFIHSTIIFHIQQCLPDHLRIWLPIFQVLLYETDLKVFNEATGKPRDLLIPYKQVCKSIAEEVLNCEALVGFSNSTFSCSSSELFRINASCQIEKFDRLIYWIFNGFFNFSLTAKRLSTLVSNLISTLNDTLNDATSMCGLFSVNTLFPEPSKSNESNISIFKQKEFLKSIQTILKGDNQQDIDLVFDKIKQVRDCIVSNPEAMFIQISHSDDSNNKSTTTTDKSYTQTFVDKWNEYLTDSNIKLNKKRKPQDTLEDRPSSNNQKQQPITNPIPFFQPLERTKTIIPTPFTEQLIMKGSESNNLLQYTSLPINSIHEDYPAVALLCNIFNSKEGEIRKKGYSYGHSLSTDTTKHKLIFGLTESSSPIKALSEFHKWLKTVRDNPTEIVNKLSIEIAICTEIYDFYSTRSSPQELIVESYINILKGLKNFQHSIELLNRFKAVTYEKIIEVFNRYFIQFLDFDKVFLTLTVNPSSVSILSEELKDNFGITITSKFPSQLFIPFNYDEYKLLYGCNNKN